MQLKLHIGAKVRTNGTKNIQICMYIFIINLLFNQKKQIYILRHSVS